MKAYRISLFIYVLVVAWPIYSQIALTTMARVDGFGAQMLHIIATFSFAELHNQLFCYRPFDTMEHNYDNDPDFIAKKETLLNFGGTVLSATQAREQGYLVQEMYCLNFFNENIAHCTAPLEKIKRIFRANKQHINNYFNNGRFNIAIHIRRFNAHDSFVYGTDVPDRLYLRVIDKLRKKYSHLNPLIHIYSQGERKNFKKYHGRDIVLHLNESVEDTYLGLVFANVLITGRSSLSYTAGYLSDGLVYYTFYCAASPLPHWKSVTELLVE